LKEKSLVVDFSSQKKLNSFYLLFIFLSRIGAIEEFVELDVSPHKDSKLHTSYAFIDPLSKQSTKMRSLYIIKIPSFLH